MLGECDLLKGNKRGPERPQRSWRGAYLVRLSSLSGGRTTNRPSIGKALSSMLNRKPSLCGKAAPILVQRFPVLPLLSYSSTVKTLRWVRAETGAVSAL